MFRFSPASLQTFIDMVGSILEDRVWCSTVRVPNVRLSCDGHLEIVISDCNCSKYFCVFFFVL
jgi:hypothetical protein